MTATIELTEEQLAEIKELTQEQQLGEALRRAMCEYIRYAKRMRLKELSDKVTMENNWQELEQREIDAQNTQSRSD